MKKINLTKKQVLSFLLETLTILCGTFILALGFKIFLAPRKIVPGGFMGLAQIVFDVIAKTGFEKIPVAVWYILLNLCIYVFAVKSLGIKFGIRTGIGIISYSLFVALVEKIGIPDLVNKQFPADNETALYILYAIYGGVIMGIGTGLVFRGNGSTGGSDMIAVLLNKSHPNISTGQIVLIVNAVVVFLSAIVYESIVLPLFALISIFLCSKMADIFIDGIKSVRAYYIFTSHSDTIAKTIMENVNRGVTNFKGTGMFSQEDKDMLLVIIRRNEVNLLKQIVKKEDPDAFMFSTSIKEAYGRGFIQLDKPDSNKKKKTKNLNNNASEINNANIDINSTNIDINSTDNSQINADIKSNSKEAENNIQGTNTIEVEIKETQIKQTDETQNVDKKPINEEPTNSNPPTESTTSKQRNKSTSKKQSN